MNQKIQNVFRKTFGGLNRDYLVRQYFFAVVLAVVATLFFSWVEQEATKNPDAELSWTFYILLVIDTVLYPYSRWVYETELRSSLRNFESQNEYGYKPCIERRFQNAETLQSRNQTNSS